LSDIILFLKLLNIKGMWSLFKCCQSFVNDHELSGSTHSIISL